VRFIAGELGGAGCQILGVEVLKPVSIYLCRIASIGESCVLFSSTI